MIRFESYASLVRVSDPIVQEGLSSPDSLVMAPRAGSSAPSTSSVQRRRCAALSPEHRLRRRASRLGDPGPQCAPHGGGGSLPPRAGSRLLPAPARPPSARSEEHTSELQSLMRTSYAVFCLKKKKHN